MNKLLTLPPELRNQIWALVFERREEIICIVDLSSVRPPEDALLHVSRQIRSEAMCFYKAACKKCFDYFFVLSVSTPMRKSHTIDLRSQLATLSDKDVRSIKHLMIVGPRNKLDTESFLFSLGAWRGISVLPNRPPPPNAGVFVPQIGRKSIRLPTGGWATPRVYENERGRPGFTFLEVSGGEGLVMEAEQTVGWN